MLATRALLLVLLRTHVLVAGIHLCDTDPDMDLCEADTTGKEATYSWCLDDPELDLCDYAETNVNVSFSMIMAVDDPAAFVADPAAKAGVKTAIATQLDADESTITVELRLVDARRLAEARALQAAQKVAVDISITVPEYAASTLQSTISSTTAESFTTAITTAVDGAYTVNVESVSSPVVGSAANLSSCANDPELDLCDDTVTFEPYTPRTDDSDGAFVIIAVVVLLAIVLVIVAALAAFIHLNPRPAGWEDVHKEKAAAAAAAAPPPKAQVVGAESGEAKQDPERAPILEPATNPEANNEAPDLEAAKAADEPETPAQCAHSLTEAPSGEKVIRLSI